MAPSSRRSRNAKMESSEEEEVEGSTQPSQSRTQSQSQSKSKSQRARGRRQVEEDSAEEDQEAAEEDEEIPDFDPDTFRRTNQPLDPTMAARKIGAFANDWATLDAGIKGTLPIVSSVGVVLEETRTSDVTNPKYDVDQAMRNLIDAQEELEIHRAVIGALKVELGQVDEMVDAEERYEKSLKRSLNAYRQKTSRQKYAQNETYAQYRQEVWEVRHRDEGMPPMNQLIPKEDADSDDDSDIEVGGATQSFKCPLTLGPLLDPMTSKVCGHSFDRQAVQDYFKNNRSGKAKCPSTGCPKELSLADFKVDKDLARRAQAAERRRLQQEEDERDDEDDMEVV